MSEKFKAVYYDGKTSKQKKIIISISGSNLHLEFDKKTLKIWKISDLIVQSNLPKNLIKFEYGEYPPEIISLENPEFKKRFEKIHSQKNKLLFFSTYLTLCFLIIIFIFFTIPSISSSLKNFVPISIENKIGNYLINELFPNRKICQREDGQKAAKILLERLSYPYFEYEFKLEVIDSDLVNAIAFPGGKIVIFRGLLEKIENVDALAGVLYHEMQHILQKHGIENVINQTALSGVLKILTLGESDFSTKIFEGIKILSILKYTRELEKEADKLALRMLFQKKINPKEMLSLYFTLKENSESLPEIISTHPDMTKRIENLKKLIDSYPHFSSERILSEKDWINLKNICQINQ